MSLESKHKSSVPEPARRTKRRLQNGARARAVLDRPAAPRGWDASDEHEIELRRWRGRTEIVAVETLESDHPSFGVFRMRSENGTAYEVEIRTLDGFDNACGCIDYQVNGLGRCKHMEVLAGLRRRGVRAFPSLQARRGSSCFCVGAVTGRRQFFGHAARTHGPLRSGPSSRLGQKVRFALNRPKSRR
jgi:hypothetical protein